MRNSTTRRGLLSAAAGAATLPLVAALPASAAPLANRITPRAQRLLDLAAEHWAAVKFEMGLEGAGDEAAYEAAIQRSEELQREIEDLADDIHATPVTSLADAVERAVVGFAHADRVRGGGLDLEGSDDVEAAALLHLLTSVLELAGIAPESIAHLA